MPIVKELHFRRSALEYIERAEKYCKEKDYVRSAEEWVKAIDEGYYLGYYKIASYYTCDYFDVENCPGNEKFWEAIRMFEFLLTLNIRQFDYDRIMSGIGYAYKKLGFKDKSYEYYVKAGNEGYYHRYIYFYERGDYKTADPLYEKYISIDHADPGHIYFDLF